MASLIEFVRANVSPRDYYGKIFPDMKWPSGGTEPRTTCIFHKDKTPSLHLNPETGAWYCHGCSEGGKSIISFQAKKESQSNGEAALAIYHENVRPVIDDKTVRRWHRRLMESPEALRYLTKTRHISPGVVEARELGFNGTRFMIPVRDEFGVCVNVKMYDPLATPKMLNYKKEEEERSYGSPPMMYPVGVLVQPDLKKIVLCEGEWDALVLESMGIPAVTVTAGCKSWAPQYNERFRGLDVVIAYDNDKDGTRYDKRVVLKNLKKLALRVRRLNIPLEVGKDVTDWVKNDSKMRARQGWVAEITKAQVLIDNPAEMVELSDLTDVPLDEASQAKWYHKRIRVKALVTGKDIAPYILPKKIRVSCNKECDSCPLAESGKDHRDVTIDPSDPRVLSMVDVPESTVKRVCLSIAGFAAKPACQIRVDALETFNLEQLLLIPSLEGTVKQYVMTSSYYIGHGLHSNRGYEFDGITTTNPQDQHATHLFDTARPMQDEIETFQLTPELKEKLKIFRPKRLKLMAHLMGIAEWQSRNITKIRQRPDLHVAVDIVFHSVQSFDFNGEYVKRGMMDVLVLGDTRCGKGFVTEGLMRHYSLGEMASGENCSFAGLVGGLQQVGKRWLVTWGMIPLNHNRLVGIDEASSLSESDIGHMSRVRSEGVAEINKIKRESTQANTRLIWLANPRSGRPIMEYNAGVVAVKELIGANEDISRFDFVLTLATNEVPSEIINAAAHQDQGDSDKYPRELCRSLVLWAWSRMPGQVKFSQPATDLIIAQAIKFGYQYSASIPLVQAENIRIKLAKISAAVAARVFSADESGEVLLVEPEHVDCACQFLRMIYSKPSMAYDLFSQRAISSTTIERGSPVDKIFEGFTKTDRSSTIDGLLGLHRIQPDNLGDYVGDVQRAKTLIGDLVKAHYLARQEPGNWYLKSPAFSAWLRAQRNGSANGVNGSHHKVNGPNGAARNGDATDRNF